jgi:hypothetical protein
MYSFNVYTTPLNVSYLKINKTNSKNLPINVNKKKKSLTWNNNVSIMITYSKEDYDRSIDHQTIRTNQINKMMNRLNEEHFEEPLQRNDTVFNQFTMWRK